MLLENFKVAAENVLYLLHFQADQLEASLLKPLNNPPNKTTLDAVGFHHNQSPLLSSGMTCWDPSMMPFKKKK